MKAPSGQRGMTLVELLMVITIMGIILSIATYNFFADLPTYRLRSSAELVASHLQHIKLRAISVNRQSWFHAYPGSGFYTAFVDEEPFTSVDNPADYLRSGLDMPDSLGGVPGFNLPPGVSFGWPSGYAAGVTGPDAITFPADSDGVTTSDNYIGFQPTGLSLVGWTSNAAPNESVVVFLKNSDDEGVAVAVAPTGRVRYYRWIEGSWR